MVSDELGDVVVVGPLGDGGEEGVLRHDLCQNGFFAIHVRSGWRSAIRRGSRSHAVEPSDRTAEKKTATHVCNRNRRTAASRYIAWW